MAISDTPGGARYRSFHQLETWQLAMDLTVDVHKAAATLPSFERFDLGRDLRRTSRSIPSNVAEGFNRRSRAAYRSNVAIALGSQAELETQVILSERLEYLSHTDASTLQTSICTVGRLLHGLWRALE